MHGQEFFFQALIFLSAAVVSVPLAKRLGLGSVLGYLLAGVLVGPYFLKLVGEEGGLNLINQFVALENQSR